MNLSIGLSGLKAAQRAIELVGTNLANAATEGYHRQRIRFSPLSVGAQGMRVSTGGVRIDGSTRAYDVLLEREHLRMLPEIGQIEQELSALTAIEAVMGNLEGDPLGDSLNQFFTALSDLTADPTQLAYSQEVVWSADGLCTNFRTLGDFLIKVKEQILEQAEHWVEELNGHAKNTGELNREIEMAFRRGVSPSLLQDQRDQAIVEMADLANIQVNGMAASDGQVNAYIWGTPLVMGTQSKEMEVGLNPDGLLGVSVKGLNSYTPQISGGKLGGLAQLYNEIIPDLQNRIDTLAKQIMWQTNNQHAQGVGRNGSYAELTGMAIDSNRALGALEPPVSNGTLCLRLMDSAGNAAVHEIHISETMTVNDILDQINLISPANLTANMANGAICLRANNGYKMDFVPDYSDNTAAVNERLTGRAVSDLREAYFSGDNAGDLLNFDLGTTPAEQLSYGIGNGSKSLYEVVEEINTWSEGAHAGWQAASAVWNDSAAGFVLQLDAYDYAGAGNVTMTNVGNVTWGATTDDVAVGAGDFDPTAGKAAFSADVEFHNIFTGTNQAFTCRVDHPDGAGNSGEIGIEEDLTIEVYNEASELVKVLSVGLGYPAGERLEIMDGVEISLGQGALTHGQEFTFAARGVSDDTMFLAAAGLNTFFQGTGAADIKVRREFYDDPQLLTTCLGANMSDNENVRAMASLQDTRIDALNGATPNGYFNDLVTTLGQHVMLREARQEALVAVHRELKNQRDLMSGVDPNEEAANLLVYERMFQSMSKFIMTQDKMMQMLMDVL